MTTGGSERNRPALVTLLWPIIGGLLVMAVLIRFAVAWDGQPPWYIWLGIAVVTYGVVRTTATALKRGRGQVGA